MSAGQRKHTDRDRHRPCDNRPGDAEFCINCWRRYITHKRPIFEVDGRTISIVCGGAMLEYEGFGNSDCFRSRPISSGSLARSRRQTSEYATGKCCDFRDQGVSGIPIPRLITAGHDAGRGPHSCPRIDFCSIASSAAANARDKTCLGLKGERMSMNGPILAFAHVPHRGHPPPA